MSDDRSLERAARLQKISHLLYRNPRGLKAAELATLCQVTPRTIQRDLRTLQDAGIPVWEDEDTHRYGIISGYYVPPIRLELQEATALFIAARLLSRYSDECNPHVASALGKLAGILPETIAEHVLKTLEALAYREEDPVFTRVMETLTVAWATGRKARIWHQSAGSENVHDYVFCPYFIEPSSVGYATYAIGHSSYFDALRTFKIERIRKAELLEEMFEIPEDFDVTELLAGSWGIVYGEEEVEVKLRFSPDASRRIKESVWHQSQEIEDLPDGGCLYSVRVNHTLEMVPWIRGFGAQVEVLAPPELRERMAEEVRQAAKLYESTRGQKEQRIC